MPKGTKVDRCYQKLKGEKGKSSAAAATKAKPKPSSNGSK